MPFFELGFDEPPSHSTVFTTTLSARSADISSNFPPLTSIFTPPNGCETKWLGNAGYEFASSIYPDNPQQSAGRIHQDCQPYQAAPAKYSPGVCPLGHTIAEVTEIQTQGTEGVKTYWQASCCLSGMTIPTQVPINNSPRCKSVWSTPFVVQIPYTISSLISDRSTFITYSSYEFPFSTDSATLKNFTTMPTGTAQADPVTVAWQIEDLSLFPTAYAASLAQKIGVSYTVQATPGTTSIIPPATNSPPTLSSATNSSPALSSFTNSPPPTLTSSKLSTGEKAGVAIGASCALIGAILFFLLMKRRRRRNTEQAAKVAEMEDQHGMLSDSNQVFLGGKWRNEADANTGNQLLDSSPINELDSKANLNELDSKADVNELDSKTVKVIPGPPLEMEAREQNLRGSIVSNR